MNKDDILRKAQTVHEDEYEMKVEIDGRRLGMEVLEVILGIGLIYFWLFDESYAIILGREVPMSILCLIPFCIMEATYAYYRFIKLKTKRYLIYGIFESSSLLLIILRFIFDTTLPW